MKAPIILLVIIILFGCEQKPKQNEVVGKSLAPEHKVIFLDHFYSAYLKEVKKDFGNRDKIYKTKIEEPVLKNYFLNSEYSHFVRENFSYPIKDTAELETAISLLKINREQIEKIISEALIQCNKYLKNDSLTFYVMPSDINIKQIIKKMGGVTGSTAGSKQILLTIDPTVESWKEMLKYTIAHEFNHAYWTNINFSNSFKWTLLSYLVFEGKADSFAHLLYPNAKTPWTSALPGKEKMELWNKIKPEIKSENPSLLSGVKFGSENYPIWGGYTLGFDILQTAFKNHPELVKTNWTNLDADTILKMSDYSK